jgi:hypothetical protein
VSGANLYAPSCQAVFTTDDIDLFLPPHSDNLVHAWTACELMSMVLSAGSQPLETPRDRRLTDRVVERRAVTRHLR